MLGGLGVHFGAKIVPKMVENTRKSVDPPVVSSKPVAEGLGGGLPSPIHPPTAICRSVFRRPGVLRPVLDKQKTLEKCIYSAYGPVWVGHKAI